MLRHDGREAEVIMFTPFKMALPGDPDQARVGQLEAPPTQQNANGDDKKSAARGVCALTTIGLIHKSYIFVTGNGKSSLDGSLGLNSSSSKRSLVSCALRPGCCEVARTCHRKNRVAKSDHFL